MLEGKPGEAIEENPRTINPREAFRSSKNKSTLYGIIIAALQPFYRIPYAGAYTRDAVGQGVAFKGMLRGVGGRAG